MATKGSPDSKARRSRRRTDGGVEGGVEKGSIAERTKRDVCPFSERDDAEMRKYRDCSDIKTVLIRFP